MATTSTSISLTNHSGKAQTRFVFDAHNHIHLSLEGGIPSIPTTSNGSTSILTSTSTSTSTSTLTSKEKTQINNLANDIINSFHNTCTSSHYEETEIESESEMNHNMKVQGVAIMSTQPRDFHVVELLSQFLQQEQQHQQQDEQGKKEDNDNNGNSSSPSPSSIEMNKIQNVIPCFGIHPWFLQQANDEFDQLVREQVQQQVQQNKDENNDVGIEMNSLESPSSSTLSSAEVEAEEASSLLKLTKAINYNQDKLTKIPSWLPYLHHKIQSNPKSHVGEIGLDSARYKYTSNDNDNDNDNNNDNNNDNDTDYSTRTKEIACPMDTQVLAFEIQLHLAAHLNKAVSIHCVKCWGVFMDTIRKVKKQRQTMLKEMKKERKERMRKYEYEYKYKHKYKSKYEKEENQMNNNDQDECEREREHERKREESRINQMNNDISCFQILPPRMYMHAFGGKPSIVDQLNAICCKDTTSELYYGFAPVINFRSPKTADTVRKVGIEHLVLESDLEDYSGVVNDLKSNISFIANILQLEEVEVLTKTNLNAYRLYGVVSKSKLH